MKRAADLLLQAQSARFAGLDPVLPAAVTPPDGDVITAALPDGSRRDGQGMFDFSGQTTEASA